MFLTGSSRLRKLSTVSYMGTNYHRLINYSATITLEMCLTDYQTFPAASTTASLADTIETLHALASKGQFPTIFPYESALAGISILKASVSVQ